MRFFTITLYGPLYLSIAINTAKLCLNHYGITSEINEFQVECVYFFISESIFWKFVTWKWRTLFHSCFLSCIGLKVHWLYTYCDFNVNVMVWSIRTEKFCTLKPQNQILYLSYNICSDCAPFLWDKVKSRAVASDMDCARTQHLAVDQLISEESKL
jgi:hypothetical protein